MIINLFTNAYLFDIRHIEYYNYKQQLSHIDGSRLTGYDYTAYKKIKNITRPDSTLQAIISRIYNNIVNHSMFISEENDNIYGFWLPIYFYCLGIEDPSNIMKCYIKHYEEYRKQLFHEYGILNKRIFYYKDLEPTKELIEYFDIIYKKNVVIYKDLLYKLPIEYFVNMIDDNSIAKYRYNRFKCDIIEKIYNHVRNNNVFKIDKEDINILGMYDQFRDYIFGIGMKIIEYKYGLGKPLIDILEKYGYEKYIPFIEEDNIFNLDIDSIPKTLLEGFGYNKYLAEYIKKTGYTIPTNIGYKKKHY